MILNLGDIRQYSESWMFFDFILPNVGEVGCWDVTAGSTYLPAATGFGSS